MQRKISVSLDQIKGWGVDIQLVLERMRDMKAELEALGCKVDIRVCGEKLRPPAKEAGNETRTRDILLGKNSVTISTQSDATPDPADWEQCGECGGCRIKTLHKDLVVQLFAPLMPGVNWFECKDCGHVWSEVAE